MTSKNKIYLNGKFLPENKALVSVRDHGFLYGDGVYETLRIYHGKIFLLNEHLRRLKHSLDGLWFELPMSLKQIGAALQKTVNVNKMKDGVVRLTVTRGTGPYGFDIRACLRPTIAIEVYPFKPYPSHFFDRGMTVGVVDVRRNSPRSLPPHVKSTSCVNGIMAKMASIRLRASEGLMISLEGTIAEGTVSNVFLVKNKKLYTPALTGHLLAGVTRDFVIKLARRLRIPVIERKLPARMLVQADEVFLTNTTMEVMPVGRLHFDPGIRRLIGARSFVLERPVGPVTRRLRAEFTRFLGE
jgi:branched-chain amino acid aminotransferase